MEIATESGGKSVSLGGTEVEAKPLRSAQASTEQVSPPPSPIKKSKPARSVLNSVVQMAPENQADCVATVARYLRAKLQLLYLYRLKIEVGSS